MDDHGIIELYWARNEQAIHETAAMYGCYCSTIARNIVKNSEDTEECVNDTYLRVWNSIPTDRPRIFKAYIGRITRNIALSLYRKTHAEKRGGGELELVFEELEGLTAESPSPNAASVNAGCGGTTMSRSNSIPGDANGHSSASDSRNVHPNTTGVPKRAKPAGGECRTAGSVVPVLPEAIVTGPIL